MKKNRNRYPKGWDEARVRRLAEHYENQSENEAVAEYEAAGQGRQQTTITVPTRLIPAIRKLLNRQGSRHSATSKS
jgi:hypothetical protein